jgi:hypothetical protein
MRRSSAYWRELSLDVLVTNAWRDHRPHPEQDVLATRDLREHDVDAASGVAASVAIGKHDYALSQRGLGSQRTIAIMRRRRSPMRADTVASRH